MATLSRDDSSSNSYYELALKQCKPAVFSELDASSTQCVRSIWRPDAWERLRDESKNSPSRSDRSQLEQRQTGLPQSRQLFHKRGEALRKASTGRYQCNQSLPSIPAMSHAAAAAAVEWNGGPGMRAVFLRSESSKHGQSGGTGVFLPPSRGDAHKSHFRRTKPACLIVLIPLRISQVLTLNVDNMALRCHAPVPRPRSRYWSSRSGASSSSTTRVEQPRQQMYVMELTPPTTTSQSKTQDAVSSHSLSQPRQDQQSNALLLELGLPTEWTY